MFKCQICGSNTTSRTPAKRITLESRVHQFPERKKVHFVPEHKRKKNAPEYADDPGGTGMQIVREALVCPQCAAARG